MKTNYFNILIIVLFTGAMITGCFDRDDTQENVKQKNQEMIDAKVQYENEWQEFKKDAELRINDIQVKIDGFKLAMEKTNTSFKAKYANEVLTLEQKNIELKKELNNFKYDGKDNWVTFKYKFFNDVEKVEKSLKEIFENKE
jgi:undecaprenyl pyrophosphate synthase